MRGLHTLTHAHIHAPAYPPTHKPPAKAASLALCVRHRRCAADTRSLGSRRWIKCVTDSQGDKEVLAEPLRRELEI
ncbi:hypothetical protein EVAR_28791_1 [Eumeta japonica]|uniref:Uncharacterized protein n=1 Tax=Eumeta variegata TaxID=151549 RepID=A0A4C1VFY5_EUMVA|nr:hypothetical protein EVAR_28791_1 [Eumeta japonica]